LDLKTQEVLKEAMELSPVERAGLADSLLSSLDKPDSTIDEIWKKEIGERLDAYEKGLMETVSVNEVLAKYKNK
jgi:putative addiction module component (TIGR02574 family)